MKKKSATINPMSLIAANQTMGDDADEHMLPFLIHVEEIRMGRGNQDNYDVCSVFLQAMLSTSASYRNKDLKEIVHSACVAWIEADKRRKSLNTERMLLTGDQMNAISKAIRFFLIAMPQVKVGIWVSAVMHGKDVLERSIKYGNYA